jgi:hypothetical protein
MHERRFSHVIHALSYSWLICVYQHRFCHMSKDGILDHSSSLNSREDAKRKVEPREQVATHAEGGKQEERSADLVLGYRGVESLLAAFLTGGDPRERDRPSRRTFCGSPVPHTWLAQARSQSSLLACRSSPGPAWCRGYGNKLCNRPCFSVGVGC